MTLLFPDLPGSPDSLRSHSPIPTSFAQVFHGINIYVRNRLNLYISCKAHDALCKVRAPFFRRRSFPVSTVLATIDTSSSLPSAPLIASVKGHHIIIHHLHLHPADLVCVNVSVKSFFASPSIYRNPFFSSKLWISFSRSSTWKHIWSTPSPCSSRKSAWTQSPDKHSISSKTTGPRNFAQRQPVMLGTLSPVIVSGLYIRIHNGKRSHSEVLFIILHSLIQILLRIRRSVLSLCASNISHASFK